jgi:HAD superfamily hydrolase (TIGR01549 family)
MIKAVIFDVDGTLIDSVDFHAEAWQKALAEYGHDEEFQKVRQQIGKGGDMLLPVFLTEKQIDEYGEELEKRRSQIFKNEYLEKVKPFPKVRELFLRILEDGKKIALASSAPKDELEKNKKTADIADLIKAETSADDAERSKPNPDIFQAALGSLGDVSAEEAIVIGDTPYDAIAAGKIRLKTIGLLSGGFPESQLLETGCIRIYKDPADLLENYETSTLSDNEAKQETNSSRETLEARA